jgi:hypothetical protein
VGLIDDRAPSPSMACTLSVSVCVFTVVLSISSLACVCKNNKVRPCASINRW